MHHLENERRMFYSIADVIDRTRSCAPSVGQSIKLQVDRREDASAISAPRFTTIWSRVLFMSPYALKGLHIRCDDIYFKIRDENICELFIIFIYIHGFFA